MCRAGAALSVERLHALTEIGRQAYADRDCFIGDPRSCSSSCRRTCCRTNARQKLRRRVSFERRQTDSTPMLVPSTATRRSSPSSTRSATRSPSSTRSSMISVPASSAPKSGVIFHNRACGFVLEPRASERHRRPQAAAEHHHSRDADAQWPGRDAVRRDRRTVPAIRAGAACEQHSRSRHGHSGGDRSAADICMERHDPGRGHRAGIGQRGPGGARPHVVPAENPLGTAQAIWIDWESGLLRGGADGRRDGLAAGW